MNALVTPPARRATATMPPRTTGSIPHPRILFVDDDPLLAPLVRLALVRAGHEVDIAVDGTTAWEAMNRVEYQLLVTDNDMPGLTGVELVALVRRAGKRLPILMASGSCLGIPDCPHADSGPVAFLQKPFTLQSLLQMVGRLLRTANGPSWEVAVHPPLFAGPVAIEPERHWGINA